MRNQKKIKTKTKVQSTDSLPAKHANLFMDVHVYNYKHVYLHKIVQSIYRYTQGNNNKCCTIATLKSQG